MRIFSVKNIKFYVQGDTLDFWIKATSLNTAFAFSKMCFDEEVAWDYFFINY